MASSSSSSSSALLLDPKLLEGLSDAEKQEALHAAECAHRAEVRAEQRALDKAVERKRLERIEQNKQQQQSIQRSTSTTTTHTTSTSTSTSVNNGSGSHTSSSNNNRRPIPNGSGAIKFVSKRQRLLQQNATANAAASDNGEGTGKKQQQQLTKKDAASSSFSTTRTTNSMASRVTNNHNHNNNNPRNTSSSSSSSRGGVAWTERDRRMVRETYLGGAKKVNMTDAEYNAVQVLKHQKKKSSKTTKAGKKTTFRFAWDDQDDTLRSDDPLYQGPSIVTNHAGGGSHGSGNGSHQLQYSQGTTGRGRNNNNGGRGSGRYNNYNSNDRYGNGNSNGDSMQRGRNSSSDREGDRRRRAGGRSSFHQELENDIDRKPLSEMTSRDWRIYRENHNIVCKGGKAPPPLRNFRDGNLLHPQLLRALEQVMQYRAPTPIQRQAIPIGLERRDLIGIAETGSGKTAAFGVPLVQYILQLPETITATSNVAEHGPLAMVLAPTRELALQIEIEFQKLLTYCGTPPNKILATPIVGGQNMTAQAQRIRAGVHIVVGTPGRINECLELTYMVLNQCSYCVLDEGDRMIDMGFAPQLESILDHMGGSLKSENEHEAYEQEKEDLNKLKKNLTTNHKSSNSNDNDDDEEDTTMESHVPKHRVTSMFSATMPMEVEQMAKKYLRHPAIISVGDRDSRKNARIEQKVLFLSSPSQKDAALKRLILDPRFIREKVIVFVNEKKHCEGVARQIERGAGRRCVVLHGGKSQEEREKNLATFRQVIYGQEGNGVNVLVATDVAGRGLDISNIAHVINYDLPGRSIDSYSHRIGRTGRAGKVGLATSLLTDEDEGIMGPLKAYLESTGSAVPDKLARHPAAANSSKGNAGMGNRDNVIH